MSRLRELFGGMSDSAKQIPLSFKSKKKLYLLIFASLILAAAIVGISVGVSNSGHDHHNSSESQSLEGTAAHTVLKSSCSSTLYPELCYSTIATVPGLSKKVTSQKDVIELSINITVNVVEQNYFKIKKLSKRKNLTKREKGALHDCLETIDDTLDELHETVKDLEKYQTKKSLKEQADDLITLVSAAITNQESCIDGFSHDGADKQVRKELIAGQRHVERLCSNALAMICNMTNTDIAKEANYKSKGRNLEEQEEEGTSGVWPEWLSAGDRRLLQSSTVTPNVVVAADGSGNFKTVAEAVAAAPEGSSTRYVIRIKAGVYRESVDVPKKKTNIMFLGDGRTNTIITASKNVQDGSTTFNSATVGQFNYPSTLFLLLFSLINY